MSFTRRKSNISICHIQPFCILLFFIFFRLPKLTCIRDFIKHGVDEHIWPARKQNAGETWCATGKLLQVYKRRADKSAQQRGRARPSWPFHQAALVESRTVGSWVHRFRRSHVGCPVVCPCCVSLRVCVQARHKKKKDEGQISKRKGNPEKGQHNSRSGTGESARVIQAQTST